jgi:hypothetical protein
MVLREGFKQIQGTWDVVASGANTIYFTVVVVKRGREFYCVLYPCFASTVLVSERLELPSSCCFLEVDAYTPVLFPNRNFKA